MKGSERHHDFKESTDPRQLLWQARTNIIEAARHLPIVKSAMDHAGKCGLKGDACFVMVASTLLFERDRILKQHDHDKALMEAKIAYLEAKCKGPFAGLIAIIRGWFKRKGVASA